MSATLFKKVDYSLLKLIFDIEQGEIGLPDIQRPFVWEATKVRDLFDSMYKGFPVGYLLFWSNDHMNGTKQIGTSQKQVKVPRLLIVDGQQRLTSLYAVLKDRPVLTNDFQEKHLRIAFRPSDARFEVTDAAIERDPEFIPDISRLWAEKRHPFVKQFLSRLNETHPLSDEDEDRLVESIDKLYDLQDYPFTAMEVSSNVNEEQVAEIFVRINSKGVTLKQADFILTLLSVFWDDGRAELEAFCRSCRQPAPIGSGASPFNHFIQPEPDQLLRACVGFGFKRARLQHVYSILRGKNLETGEFSDAERGVQFAILKEAQSKVLDLTNWHEFLKVLIRAGFRSRSMITSETGVIYAYTIYLIGTEELKIDPFVLRNVLSRWYFMTALSARYSASPESAMEADLARLRGVAGVEEFIAVLEQIIRDTFTEDYWNITLVNELQTSSSRSPVLFAFYAALNLLDAQVLFSKVKVSELLDPALKTKKQATEKHHLFPKEYLKSIGITDIREINQVANYALVEWGDNISISDSSPQQYLPLLTNRFSPSEMSRLAEWHALPTGWESMPYSDFLAERRRLMAQVIRKGFETI